MKRHPSLGQAFPLGASVYTEGVNFSVFSKNSTAVELLLFDDTDATAPSRIIPLDPARNRSFYYWHLFVPGMKAGQLYGYRVHGPFAPEKGHRFDGRKLLLDPYARAVAVPKNYDRGAATRPGDTCATAMKSVVVDFSTYDWEGDRPLGLDYSYTIVYEMHVRGFTQHPSSNLPPDKRGTYAGLIEKIPYLKGLGITAVELLPVQQFDPYDAPGGLNYWGYSPIAFFAPHAHYSSDQSPLGPVNEFRDMVKALHREGIEVILDVVFNHTAEGNRFGPTLCYRGLENRAYYLLEDDPSYYSNYSGTGNAINGNHSIPRRLIMDALRHWVTEMHVDGFRFDLASVLARGENGRPLDNPPILWEIESDPVLANTKIIAEAWDAAGLYQVGSFIGHRWAEWNGKFRDDVRQFIKGDEGMSGAMVQRLLGSPDIYPDLTRNPRRSINFVTAHDGFTLHDLVSYNQKHNEANGEDNRDGHNHNHSWNWGVEGPTDDPAINAKRLQQMKNFMVILLLAQGTPMILMGDEIGRTQQGNNNGYCLDNELSWFNWSEIPNNVELLHFVRKVIHFTHTHTMFRDEAFWTAEGKGPGPYVTWHGVKLNHPDWGTSSRSVACTVRDPISEDHMCLMLNAYWEALTFELLPLPGGEKWHRVIDTSLPPPNDFCDLRDSQPYTKQTYTVKPRTAVVLMAKGGHGRFDWLRRFGIG